MYSSLLGLQRVTLTRPDSTPTNSTRGNSTQKLDIERLYTRAVLYQITLHQKQ